MNEDLKWSDYDFKKIPLDDIVSVGNVLCFIVTYSQLVGCLVVFATITVATVGLMLEAVKKIIDQLNFVCRPSMK